MANPCEAGYETQLANEYLVVPGGGDTANPISGMFGVHYCAPADIRVWRQAVLRLRAAILQSAQANPAITLSDQLQTRVARWLTQSVRLPEAGLVHLFGTIGVCEEDVRAMVTFGQEGVAILARMHCVYSQQNGTVPNPPAKSEAPDPGLPGPDWVWYAGLLFLGLIAWKVVK